MWIASAEDGIASCSVAQPDLDLSLSSAVPYSMSIELLSRVLVVWNVMSNGLDVVADFDACYLGVRCLFRCYG